MDKVRVYRMLLRLSAAVFFIGALFRIMHWPFGHLTSITALVLIAVLSILYYSSKLEKTYIDQLAIVGIPLWAVYALLRVTHAPYQSEIRIGVLIIALVYIAFQAIKWYRGDKSNGIRGLNLERSSYVVGAVLIGVGLLFKFQRWPFAGVILLSGLGLMLLNFFLSMFSKDHEE